MLVRLPWGLRRTGARLTWVSPAPNISHQPQGEKNNAAKASLPTPTQARPGSAQPQMETCMCARNCTERAEREWERQNLLIVPLIQPVLLCHQWWMVHWKAQKNCARLLLSVAFFELRHEYQMSFYQVAIHWHFEEGLWTLMALLHC